MITQESIDRVMASAHIETVVGDFVALKKRGANLLGLCPFHQEKSPSFTVSPVKGLYKCFGCGKAGSAVGFIMEHESLTFPEAIKYLAGRFNIPIEETEQLNEERQNELKSRESILILLEFAAKYYVEKLWENNEGIEKGLSYFEGRGFTEETIKKFGLGYAPAGFENFTPHALQSGFKLEFLTAAGLSKVSEKSGKPFDFFNGRVMFPIQGLNGKVIGFAGRVLEAGAFGGKYLNSPETAVYNKREILYGLYLGRQAIKQENECLLVEGYTDVITLHQYGVANVVASSGTSLTEEQARLIFRFTPNITLLYDGDAAGVKAAVRGVDILLSAGLDVKICILPAPEDPDSYTRKYGGEALRDYLKANARNFITFTATRHKQESANDPLKKSEAAREMLKSIKAVKDPIKRRLYLDECARILEMDVQMLGFELRRMMQAEQKSEADAATKALPTNQTAPASYMPPDETITEESRTILERAVIRLLIKTTRQQHEEFSLLDTIISFIEMEEIEFTDELSSIIFTEIKSNAGQDPGAIAEKLTSSSSAEVRQFASDALSDIYELSPKWAEHEIFVTPEDQNFAREGFDIITRLSIKRLQEEEKKLAKQLEDSNDEELESLKILEKIMETQRKIHDKAGLIGTDFLPQSGISN